MAAPEAMGEFHHYNGDCVWAALLMGAHHLDPVGWPLDYGLLDALTQAAIAQNIGVGSEGQANRQQLEYMLNLWGFTWSDSWKGKDYAIGADDLKNILLDALSAGRPVLLGMTNGGALPGDERGLHGHEIAILHYSRSGDYAAGDGDNRTCIDTGQAVTYTLDNLTAARVNSAYILIESPAGQGGGTGAIAGGIAKTAYKVTANDSFLPIAQALDDAEQFLPFDVTNPIGSFTSNIAAFALRALIVFVGLMLILGVISYVMRAQQQMEMQTLQPVLEAAAKIAPAAAAAG